MFKMFNKFLYKLKEPNMELEAVHETHLAVCSP